MVFPLLHRKFCENNGKVFVSFPNYRFDKRGIAGNVIKVAAESEYDLKALDLVNAFNGISDYVHVSENIEKEDVVQKFRIVHGIGRARAKRYILRGNDVPDEGLFKYIRMHNNKVFKNAYVSMRSNTNGQKFKIFFKPLAENDDVSNMHINTYGLFAANS